MSEIFPMKLSEFKICHSDSVKSEDKKTVENWLNLNDVKKRIVWKLKDNYPKFKTRIEAVKMSCPYLESRYEPPKSVMVGSTSEMNSGHKNKKIGFYP